MATATAGISDTTLSGLVSGAGLGGAMAPGESSPNGGNSGRDRYKGPGSWLGTAPTASSVQSQALLREGDGASWRSSATRSTRNETTSSAWASHSAACVCHPLLGLLLGPDGGVGGSSFFFFFS